MDAQQKLELLAFADNLQNADISGTTIHIDAAHRIRSLILTVEYHEDRFAAQERPMREILNMADRCLREMKD